MVGLLVTARAEPRFECKMWVGQLTRCAHFLLTMVW